MTKPVQKYATNGGISLAVWENIANFGGQEKKTHSVSIERRYPDKEGKWQSTTSLREADIQRARLLLQKAYDFIVSKGQQDSNASGSAQQPGQAPGQPEM